MRIPGLLANLAGRRWAFPARILSLVLGAASVGVGLHAQCRPAASCPSAPFHAGQADTGPLQLDPRMASPGSFSPALPGISFWQDKQNPPQPSPAPQPKQQHSPSATTGSPGHIFWVVPAFKVEYGQKFQPLTAKEKFQEWARGAYDPLGLGTGAVEAATIEHSSSDGFCGYGHGWAGYGKCFGSLELDADVSSFIGDFALTALLHQDPRYFRLGRGSFGRRVGYAVARVFVTYNDSGRTVFYSSALSGTAIAAGLSNLYYPQQDRGLGHTLTRVAIDLGNTALYNGAAEFWPDFNSGLHRVLRKFKR